MEQKRDQLEHLGFELRPFHAETKLVVGGHEAFVEAFLGLRKIEVTEWKAFETRFGIKLPLNDPSFSKGTMQVQAFESAQKLINLAGAIEPKVRLANIAERAGDIIGLNELFSGATNISPITFRVKWPDKAPLPEKLDVVFAGYIPLADVTLVYYGIAEMRPETQADMVFWKFHTIEPREIVTLNNFPAGYEEFVDRAKAKENIDNVMMAEVPDVQIPVGQLPC